MEIQWSQRRKINFWVCSSQHQMLKLQSLRYDLQNYIKVQKSLRSKPDSICYGTGITTEIEQKMRLDLYNQNLERKMGLAGDNRYKYETIDDRIVFYRFLGHLEIKNGQKWKLDTRCWICDKWKYSWLIVNPLASHTHFKASEDIDTSYYFQKILNKNLDENSQIQLSSNWPKIAGNFSEWKIEDMMTIDKFFDCLLRNKMPSLTQYVENKPDYISKMSMIMNEDIHILFRNRNRFGPHCQQTHLAKWEKKLLEESKLNVGKHPKRKKTSKLRVNGELSMAEKSYSSIPKHLKKLSDIKVPTHYEFTHK